MREFHQHRRTNNTSGVPGVHFLTPKVQPKGHLASQDKAQGRPSDSQNLFSIAVRIPGGFPTGSQGAHADAASAGGPPLHQTSNSQAVGTPQRITRKSREGAAMTTPRETPMHFKSPADWLKDIEDMLCTLCEGDLEPRPPRHCTRPALYARPEGGCRNPQRNGGARAPLGTNL
jgi:hypothetical protein